MITAGHDHGRLLGVGHPIRSWPQRLNCRDITGQESHDVVAVASLKEARYLLEEIVIRTVS